jgi:hypothetical protein
MFYKKQIILRGLLAHTPNPQAGGPIADFCERDDELSGSGGTVTLTTAR